MTDFQKIQVPVGELASTLDAIDLRNLNTYRRIDVKDISIFDKTQRGDYLPTKALSEAGDAVISMDGIDVKRTTNAIDDLLPGVTLNLKAPSDSPVELSVRHDVEGIKKQVESLVGAYNQVITDIDVLTRNDPTIIDECHLSQRRREEEGPRQPRADHRGPVAAAAQGLAADDDDEPLPHLPGQGSLAARPDRHLHRHARPGVRHASTRRGCADTWRSTSRSSPPPSSSTRRR